jgi:GNAT superfamily N-acetyltransferase
MAAAAAVWRACDLDEDGEPDITEDDLVAFTQRPSFELGAHSVGVRDGDELVAVAFMLGRRRAFVSVLPEQRGRGTGTWLARWTQDAARGAGSDTTDQTLSGNARAAIALVRAGGYRPGYEGWTFELELGREPDPPALPPGYSLRALVPGNDDGAAHRVIEDAFGEWQGRDPRAFEDWAAETLGRPGFRADQIQLVAHGNAVVAAMVTIQDGDNLWVDQLAVVRDHRRRGVARALLQRAFVLAWRGGARRVRLSTDSRTGARAVYERVGMRVPNLHGLRQAAVGMNASADEPRCCGTLAPWRSTTPSGCCCSR